MKLAQVRNRLVKFYRQTPKKYFLLGGVGLLAVVYALIFFIPKPVEFSYTGETCTRQLTLFPAIQKGVSADYDVSFKDTWKVGVVPISSLKTCFTAKTSPNEGQKVAGIAPFGSLIARKQFSIAVPKAPVAQLTALKKAIPATKPLLVPMTSADAVHSYKLKIADKDVVCKPKDEDLSCDITPLKLTQGADYSYLLQRQFKQERASEVGKGTVKTLKAVVVADSSIKPTQTVYDRPKTLTFIMDKDIKKATAEVLLDGKSVKSTTSIKDKIITLTFEAELPREKTYAVTIKEVEAGDGSGLVEPYAMQFVTSGGPQVANVSVGQTGVGQSAGIILTFDQNLSKKQDITKLIGFSGGDAAIQKLNDTQVRVQLSNLPLCQPFSIAIEAGLASEHDILSTKKWSFSGKTICYITTQYGTSLKGRPLIAYQFGSSGPVTMYVGAIHGNEASSSGLMKAWVSELEANSARTQGKRIIVIPSINPDGVAAGTRTNSRGVNLSRNFPTSNWVSDINDTDGQHPGGGGTSPLSEPEAAALANYTRQVRPNLLLSFHAIGSLVAGDPGGYSAGFAARYASMVGYRDVTNSSNSSFEYDITGSYEDWTYRNQGIPSMVIELGSYGYFSIAHHRSALWAMVQ
jgi:predicted deacylase